MELTKRFFVLSAIATLGIGCPSVSSDAVSASERPLTKQEVATLYEGKSWQWSDGVAYFAPKGRFLASAGSGNNRSSVSGDWFASEDGRLCFSGTWSAKSGRRWDRTCLLHKTKDGHIHQRRLPNGEWYVFKHEPEEEGDEFKKLVPGDRVSASGAQ